MKREVPHAQLGEKKCKAHMKLRMAEYSDHVTHFHG